MEIVTEFKSAPRPEVGKMLPQVKNVIAVMNLPAALKRYVGTSVVKDSKTGKTWLKVVNALPRTLKLQVNGLGSKAVEVKARSSQVFEL